MFVYLAVSETTCTIHRPDLHSSQASREKLKKQLMVKITFLSMSKPKISQNLINAKISEHVQNTGSLIVGEGMVGLGAVTGGWVSPPYIAQFSWFPPYTRHPLYNKVCSAHHRVNLYPAPHQWISPSCPIVCRRLSCAESLPCPVRNKLFAIL